MTTATFNPFYAATSTSLSRLDDHDWQIVRSRWMRGIDWCIEKQGRHWKAADCFGIPMLFKTKKAAGEYVDNIVCMESKWRKSQAWERDHAA